MLGKFHNPGSRSHRKMTVAEFIAVPPSHCQRDTERHAKALLAKMKRQMLPRTSDVAIVRYPDGALEKVDGHTRAFLWSQRRLTTPPELFVEVHDVADRKQAERLYFSYNNAATSKLATDTMVSLGKVHDIDLQSAFFANGRGTKTIMVAAAVMCGLASSKAITLESAYDLIAPHLPAVDAAIVGRAAPPSWVLIGALLSVARHNGSGRDFLERVMSRIETDVRHPANKVHELMVTHKTKTTEQQAVDLASRYLNGFERWLGGKALPGPLRSIKLDDYHVSAR